MHQDSASPRTVEIHSDRTRRRDDVFRVHRAVDAERLIENVGFAYVLTDARRSSFVVDRRKIKLGLVL